MTIPIKIECPCGQNYAFDVEPVDGRMPSEIACPSCGVDGTDAANAIIAQNLAAAGPATPPVKPAIRMRVGQAGGRTSADTGRGSSSFRPGGRRPARISPARSSGPHAGRT
jgi:hypothetical protein